MVAGALYNQKIVLKKIQMLNETTNDIIRRNAQMLVGQGAEIQIKSMEASISAETMKTAFNDVMEALDSISTYKQEALPKMRILSISSRNWQPKAKNRFRSWRRAINWGCS